MLELQEESRFDWNRVSMRICFLRMRYILFESFSEQFAGATSSSSLMAEAQGKTKGDAGLDAEGGEEKVVDTNTETPAAPVEAPAAPVEAPAVPEEASAEAPAAAADDEKTALNALYGKKKKKKKKKKAFVPDV